MQKYRLFAAGAAVALLLGGAAPAFAKPAHPSHPAHPAKPTHPAKPAKPAKQAKQAKPAKPAKGPRVSGGGVSFKGAEFSVQVGAGKSKGHFNYTSADGAVNVRCKGLTVDSPAAGTAHVTSTKCFSMAADGTRTPIVSFEATFVDGGKGQPDVANITTLADEGQIKSGSIKVR